jgi:hypothetical protein
MLTPVGGILVRDLAQIDAIGQDPIKMTATECLAAKGWAARADVALVRQPSATRATVSFATGPR